MNQLLAFIERSDNKYNYKYDYSKVNYINNKIKVTIICPLHGEFDQSPNAHLRGGCRKCGIIKRTNNRTKSKEEFINESIQKHNNKYDYSKVNYINISTSVTIICPIHGEFSQIAKNHIKGKGCKPCGIIKLIKPIPKSKEEFILRANKKYNNKYDYSNINYLDYNNCKLIIKCPFHGKFKQTPKNHIKQGCRKCILYKKRNNDWLCFLNL